MCTDKCEHGIMYEIFGDSLWQNNLQLGRQKLNKLLNWGKADTKLSKLGTLMMNPWWEHANKIMYIWLKRIWICFAKQCVDVPKSPDLLINTNWVRNKVPVAMSSDKPTSAIFCIPASQFVISAQ